jgi:hypothetical protein
MNLLRALAGASFVWLLGSATVEARSCSDAYADCMRFCTQTTQGLQTTGTSCKDDCAQRVNSCKRNGTFRWNRRPVETGLEKK